MTLIPFFQSRVQEVIEALEKVVKDCNDLRNDEAFGAAYLRLVDASGLGRAIGKIPTSNAAASQLYFDRIKEITVETLNRAKQTRDALNSVCDIASFSQAVVGLSVLCSILESSKNNAFAITPLAMFSFTRTDTGEVHTQSLDDLQIVNFPFQNVSENLGLLAQSTRENIEVWVKEQLEWKTRHLSIVEHRYSINVNMLTITSAITVSWLFLTLNDPYKVKVTEVKNELLNKEIEESRVQLSRRDSEILVLSEKVAGLKRSLHQCSSQ